VLVTIAIAIMLAIGIPIVWQQVSKDEPTVTNQTTADPAREPELKAETVLDGLSNGWDMVFVDANTVLFDERAGQITGLSLATKERWDILKPSQLWAEGEGGMMGLTIDSAFIENHHAYVCYNAKVGTKRSVRVARFTLSADFKTATDFKDIIPDIQSQGGRHSGCRLATDRDGSLWVGTGDSALRTAAQDPKSLAGKILRVDREGKGISGNLPAPFDPRIYSYGHRNTQGLVLLASPLDNGAIGLTAEHGPDIQDEVNWLKPGNFGWDPAGSKSGYDESVPMTDIAKYPDAIPALWNSGESTVAVSGMTFLTSSKWRLWQGWTAVATLKGEHVRVLHITSDGSVRADKEILKDFGRIRTVLEGPDGNLYLTTDNGNKQDKIIRVVPE
jgi:glucose/arabinose dehydrogenase